MAPPVETNITITGLQDDITGFVNGLTLLALFINILWTSSISSRAGIYLNGCPQLLVNRISRVIRWIHTYLLIPSFALACLCESGFIIKTWYHAIQGTPSGGALYSFVPCLLLQIVIMVLLQATVVYRMFYLAGGKLRATTILQVTLHQVPLLACGIVFASSILASESNSPRDGLLCTLVAVWLTHVVIVCASLGISLKDIRGSSHLSEEERLVNWLSIGVAALNSVGYSLMILNACWYVYSPSLIRLILHIVLAKLHISFTAMLLRMSEDCADGEPPELEVDRSISLQDEKQLRELLAGTGLV